MAEGKEGLTAADQTVCVRTFGAFSVDPAEAVGAGADVDAINIAGRAKRIWTLIAYLVIHRDREVPVTELFDVLWTEDQERSDPLKTLQHNVSRARDVLERRGIANARELIVSLPGAYRWNPKRDTTVDLEIFQALCEQADAAVEADERIDLLKQAIAVYRGDFLPGLEGESWVTPIGAYSRSLYVNKCLSLTRLLGGEENMGEIASVCEKALHFAPESEELNIRYIRALTADHCAEKAVEVYENVRKLLSDKLGVLPSSELELAYEEARQSLKGGAISIDAIRTVLVEQAFDGEGMRCDWTSFLALVRREARNASRAERGAIVLAVSFEGENDALEARRVETALAKRLRAGDVYTRLNAKQFLVLLPEAGEENVEIIVRRLKAYFSERFPKSRAHLQCEWYALEDPAK